MGVIIYYVHITKNKRGPNDYFIPNANFSISVLQCINRMIGKGAQPTLSLVPKTSIKIDFPVEKYIPPNLARREKPKTKGLCNYR